MEETVKRDPEWTFAIDPRRDGLNGALRNVEKSIIFAYLLQSNWNIAKVCRILKIHRQSLYNKIKRFQLEKHFPTKTHPSLGGAPKNGSLDSKSEES
jgi:DNA-binding NtrC family response regulator